MAQWDPFAGNRNDTSEWWGLFMQCMLEASKRLLFSFDLDHDANAVVEDEAAQA
jgi:hypothetical protein